MRPAPIFETMMFDANIDSAATASSSPMRRA
jgi:hypothetical protein